MTVTFVTPVSGQISQVEETRPKHGVTSLTLL
ncbi:hypothetical protein FGSG_13589 [Fusarium graminearum PH-1]|nr:hypothetical protein FGSG_13589 [Fusarium graminearum PH-1]ESU16041.1 hypothetical protein FGSG_13589 [Fusarium graminearum PH-1]|eukprot:XP_011328275.1 hypothetical protein FGSG_13589 [Fusarium graminearum PH-1]